jgi:hypothetical protein
MILLAIAAVVAACTTGDCASQQDAAPVVFKKIGNAYGRLGPVGPYYPVVAVDHGLSGFAILDCAVAAGGALNSCEIVEESPKGVYFGAAAQVMARRKHIRAAEPYIVGQRLKVRVPFAMRP